MPDSNSNIPRLPAVTVTKVCSFTVDEWTGCTVEFDLDVEVSGTPDKQIMQHIISQILTSPQFLKYKQRAAGRTVEVCEDGTCEGPMVEKPVFVPRRVEDFDEWDFSGRKGQISGSDR